MRRLENAIKQRNDARESLTMSAERVKELEAEVQRLKQAGAEGAVVARRPATAAAAARANRAGVSACGRSPASSARLTSWTSRAGWESAWGRMRCVGQALGWTGLGGAGRGNAITGCTAEQCTLDAVFRVNV